MGALGKIVPLLRAATVGTPSRSKESDTSYRAAMANELAVAVEHVLNSRYGGAQPANEASSRPRGVLPKVTAESLLEELAAARKARGARRQPTRADDAEAARPSGSSLTGLFACAAVVVILLALGGVSPLRDYVPSPLRDYLPTKASVTRLLTGG